MASNYPDEGRPASEGGDEAARLPFRGGGPGQPPAPKHAPKSATARPTTQSYVSLSIARAGPSPLRERPSTTWGLIPAAQRGATGRADGESWDEMVARFGDTWT